MLSRTMQPENKSAEYLSVIKRVSRRLLSRFETGCHGLQEAQAAGQTVFSQTEQTCCVWCEVHCIMWRTCSTLLFIAQPTAIPDHSFWTSCSAAVLLQISLFASSVCSDYLEDKFTFLKEVLTVWMHPIDLVVCWVPVAPQEILDIEWLTDCRHVNVAAAGRYTIMYDAARSYFTCTNMDKSALDVCTLYLCVTWG